jgi:spore coat protein U-like protein
MPTFQPKRGQRATPFSTLVTAALLACVTPSGAATVQTQFEVSATVQQVCAVAATDLDFGAYIASEGAPNDATSTVTATCSPGSDYSIALNAGTTAGGTEAVHLMTDGASHTLTYNLYSDAGRTTKWGDGTLSTEVVSGTGDGTPQDYFVYGEVPSGQYVSPGSYSDTVTATVTY